MNNIKIMNLKVNGLDFNPIEYSSTDSIDATMVFNDSNIIHVRVTSYDEVIITNVSDLKQQSKEFKKFLVDFEDDYNVRHYIVSKYQEYLYPFMYDDEIKDNKHILLDWCSTNMNQDKELNIRVTSFALWEHNIVVKLNDIGVSVDYYDDIHKEPTKSYIYYFEDYEVDPTEKMYPISCGVTRDNRPLLVFMNPYTKQEFTKWYHTTFIKRDDALDFLKDNFRDGVLIEDMDEFWTYIQFKNMIDLKEVK